MDFAPLQDFRRGAQIFQIAIGAHANRHLVNFEVGKLADRFHVLRQKWHGYKWLEFTHVEFDCGGVFGVLVAVPVFALARSGTLHKGARFLVGGKQPGFCAGFNCHVCHRKTVSQPQMIQCRPGKLHRLITRPFHANFADGVQNQILAANPFWRQTVIYEFDTLRDFQPDFAQDHSGGGVGGANAGAERAKCAHGTGVRIRAGD